MPHEVWNLGDLTASGRHQSRQFVAGIEPARGVVIGRSREPKKMLVVLDAWLEVNDFDVAENNTVSMKYSLAIGKDPLITALLLPVGRIVGQGDATSRMSYTETDLFNAHGWRGAAKAIAIDVVELGALLTSDVDVHLDWTVAEVDWWTWFVSWNNLEASPDGNLVDGDRTYA